MITLGEAYTILKHAVRDRKLRCVACHRVLDEFKAEWYPHPDGLPGPDGKRYWLYLVCPHCQYQNAWWKLLKQLERESHGH